MRPAATLSRDTLTSHRRWSVLVHRALSRRGEPAKTTRWLDAGKSATHRRRPATIGSPGRRDDARRTTAGRGRAAAGHGALEPARHPGNDVGGGDEPDHDPAHRPHRSLVILGLVAQAGFGRRSRCWPSGRRGGTDPRHADQRPRVPRQRRGRRPHPRHEPAARLRRAGARDRGALPPPHPRRGGLMQTSLGVRGISWSISSAARTSSSARSTPWWRAPWPRSSRRRWAPRSPSSSSRGPRGPRLLGRVHVCRIRTFGARQRMVRSR